MAVYLENACKYVGADNLHREKAIMDVLKLHIFHNQRYSQAIKPLQYSIVPYESQEYFTPSHYNETFSEEIKINPSFESYLVSDIEDFFQRRGKSLVDVFVDNIILLNINSSEMWASKSIKCSSFSNEAYRYRAIQSEPCSGSDLVLSLVDNEQKKPREREKFEPVKFSSYKKQLCLQIGIPAANEKEEYGQDLDFDGVDYDLNYTENTGF
ncbi:5016_t:CDS:2 [Rhizophagus irregularis]|nr:5016_t:CDS:2 [Rhizophagus irregularis]